MQAPPHMLQVFQPARATVMGFLERVFGGSANPSLEDVCTLLDLTIGRRQYCAGVPWSELEQVRRALNRSVLFVFHAAGEALNAGPANFYRSVAAYLLESRVRAGQAQDPFSILSLNWDCLLEDTLYWCLKKAKAYAKADVDYCCYTTPLGESCPHVPSLQQKAKGMFNLKLMKLHGSANWLLCPNCNRLFTGLGGKEDVWDQYVLDKHCPVCEDFSPQGPAGARQGAPLLEPFFVTPTFVKVFDNAHIQMTWHNAYVDLAEATEVVFIGYSLPEADYHVRMLLRRAIGRDTRIVAVLTKDDESMRNTPKRLRGYFAANRYRAFFGENRVECLTGGIKSYFGPLMAQNTLDARLSEVQDILAEHPVP